MMDIGTFVPVTPFEHYMLAEDTATWPMTVSVRLPFQGIVERERLMRSLESTLRFHPLLRACLQGNVGGRTRDLRWVISDLPPAVNWVGPGQAWRLSRYLNLFAEPGLRLTVLTASENPCIIVQWHHACCDGIGLLNFLHTLLLAYRDPVLFAEADAGKLHRDEGWWLARAKRRATWLQDVASYPRQLSRIVRFFKNDTVRLAGSRSVCKPPLHLTEEDFLSRTLSRTETLTLAKVARSASVTMNDLLLRIFYTVLHAWQERHQCPLNDKQIRVAIPINLRNATDPYEPAINRVSMVFLDRSKHQIQDRDALLRGLSREMEHVKRWGTGWAMIHALASVGKIRSGMARLVEAGGHSVTSALSNLGRLFPKSALGNEEGFLVADTFSIQGIEPFASVRHGVHAAVDVLTYAGRLTVTINYDRTCFARSSASELLDLYAEELRAAHDGVPH